jgi:hypothetical protein
MKRHIPVLTFTTPAIYCTNTVTWFLNESWLLRSSVWTCLLFSPPLYFFCNPILFATTNEGPWSAVLSLDWQRLCICCIYLKHVWHVKCKLNKILAIDWILLTVTDRKSTRPLVREGAPQRQDSNFQAESNIWSQVPEWTRHQDILTDWLAVRRNMTLTLTIICNLYQCIQWHVKVCSVSLLCKS